MIFGTNVIQRTWSGRQEINEEATRQGGAYPPGRALHPRVPLVALLTDLFRLYILIYPGNIRRGAKNPISTVATFYTQEIPSWGLFRSSAGGGIDQGGPLHQLHGPSNDV